MSTGRYVLPAVLALVLLASVQGVSVAADIGSKAPDFQLESLTNGAPIRLSDNFDKPTVLVFWTSWCPHCRNELPVLQNLYGELGPDKVHFLGVSLDGQLDDAVKATKALSITFPNAFGNARNDSRVVTDYDIMGVPAVFVIDKGGIIKAHHEGETSASTLREDLSALGVQ